jgi:glycosyltransferase involved in cell wall biosynthesis
MPSPPATPDVRVALESHLVPALAPGSDTALFCVGHCFGLRARVRRLCLITGGQACAPTAMGMPRPDLLQWLGGSAADPLGHSYRSGFWATVPVHAAADRTSVKLEAQVTLETGHELTVELGEIPIRRPTPPPAPLGAAGKETIVVCLATFEPDPELVRAQIESLKAQTDERWLCLVSDGGSSAERFTHLDELVSGDSRFRISRSEVPLGPYENFERALRMVPNEADLVALCDQDDRWYPEKLAVLREAIGSAELVYSDLRWTTPEGRLVRDSLWHGRRNDHRNLASLLVANTVPGAAMMFHRRLLDRALPFPDPPGNRYHDHWLALVALASGEIRYVDRPLYDWVQHRAAVSRANEGPPGETGTSSRGSYFGGYLLREVFAQTLLLRCRSVLEPRKRRALEWYLAAARSPLPFLWLALRPLRRFIGRGETLGGEFPLAQGIAWRWLIVVLSWRAKRPRRLSYDASFPNPPEFRQRRLERWRSGH